MVQVNPLNIGDINVNIPAPPMMAFQIPVTDGLQAAFFLAHGIEIAKFNWAPGGAAHPGTFISTPTSGSNYIEMLPISALQTDVNEELAMTLMVIGRKATASSAGLIGSYAGGAAPGLSIFATGSLQAGAARVSTGNATMAVTGDVALFNPLSLVTPAAGAMKLYNHRTAASATSTQTDNRILDGGGPLRIGGAYAGLNAASQIAFAAIYNRAIDDTENALMGQYMLDYMSLIGMD